MGSFLEQLFPLELRKFKTQEVINLRQGDMSAGKYTLKFTKLSKCTPFINFNPRARISKYLLGVLDLVYKECKIDKLSKEIDISIL